MAVRNYTELIAWQKAVDLVEAVYSLSSRFPREEVFGLTFQIRKAAVSVPSNIAEGQGRWNTGEFVQFLGIAHGSLREVETQTILAVRLKFVAQSDSDSVFQLTAEVGRLIQGLKKSLVLLFTAHCPLPTAHCSLLTAHFFSTRLIDLMTTVVSGTSPKTT